MKLTRSKCTMLMNLLSSLERLDGRWFGRMLLTWNQAKTVVFGAREADVIYCKKMPSAFFETQLQSLCVWHKVDTVIITGGSTSGCIRATAVDSLSRGYRTIVPEECVADKHESYHFANLTDLAIKYADVLEVQEVFDWLDGKSEGK